jgi:hypothetical protein
MNRSTDDRLMPDQMREATQVALEQLRRQYGELAPLYQVPAPPRCDPKLRDVPIGRRIALDPFGDPRRVSREAEDHMRRAVADE